MAKKKIREHDGKRLLRTHTKRFGLDLSHVRSVLVDATTDWLALAQSNPWLTTERLVAKPDMMFGQRGKHDLVLLNASWEQAQAFCSARFGQTLQLHSTTGILTHFIIEPFIKHEEEYYLSISAERETTVVRFSTQGGVDIEEHWEASVRTVELAVGADQTEIEQSLSSLLLGVPSDLRSATFLYLLSLLRLFDDLDFVLLETNPFAFVHKPDQLELYPLDLVAELDDTARFKNTKKWGDLQFPDVFGRPHTKEERFIEELDEKTGASLKLTVLNESGRIWALVAGGGASVIFADTVVDLGFGHLLGNYGEYSGAPNEEETLQYTRTILDLATRQPDGQGRVLLIGGGIANFTDIAKTFKGIVHALKEYRERLVAANMRIYVRRAGPNYQTGLQLMRNVAHEIGVPIEVFGPEKNMTEIIPMAIDFIKQSSIPPQPTQ